MKNKSEFEAFGLPVPKHRLQAGYKTVKQIAPQIKTEQAYSIVGKIARMIERDEPFNIVGASGSTIDKDLAVIDLTGRYRLLSVLLTA